MLFALDSCSCYVIDKPSFGPFSHRNPWPLIQPDAFPSWNHLVGTKLRQSRRHVRPTVLDQSFCPKQSNTVGVSFLRSILAASSVQRHVKHLYCRNLSDITCSASRSTQILEHPASLQIPCRLEDPTNAETKSRLAVATRLPDSHSASPYELVPHDASPAAGFVSCTSHRKYSLLLQ